MIFGIGIDLVEIDRIETVLNRKGSRLIDKILSEKEKELYLSQGNRGIEFLAGRFAGKEAVAKALGTGINKQLTWKNIEILNMNSGKPFVNISSDYWKDRDFIYHISISHVKKIAMAEVIIEFK